MQEKFWLNEHNSYYSLYYLQLKYCGALCLYIISVSIHINDLLCTSISVLTDFEVVDLCNSSILKTDILPAFKIYLYIFKLALII